MNLARVEHIKTANVHDISSVCTYTPAALTIRILRQQALSTVKPDRCTQMCKRYIQVELIFRCKLVFLTHTQHVKVSLQFFCSYLNVGYVGFSCQFSHSVGGSTWACSGLKTSIDYFMHTHRPPLHHAIPIGHLFGEEGRRPFQLLIKCKGGIYLLR